ncbi:MAG: hypothetical protein MUP98_04440 [Candidatus Aminicenantes bacterium]|nr:hypothetical protein [Candidatus Aminicenantes bacterium]
MKIKAIGISSSGRKAAYSKIIARDILEESGVGYEMIHLALAMLTLMYNMPKTLLATPKMYHLHNEIVDKFKISRFFSFRISLGISGSPLR